jgi:UDP-N-acetylglucosamine 2-epimerase (non-hydrolysing)
LKTANILGTRPETLDVGSNILAGTDLERIVDCARLMLTGKSDWVNPFGDGKSGARIVEVLRSKFD